MKDFLKGIIVGMGGISPGLSGSVLLVVLGLYKKTINAIGTFFKNFKENLKFLVPLFLGIGVGVLLFSKIVDYLLNNFEMYTRFAFLGLVLGTIPLFYKEVKKEGFSNKYYFAIGISFIIGILLFTVNKGLFPKVENPNLIQSIILGVAVAGSSIVPGVDSAVILSSLGLYELYVSSIANLNIPVLIPAGIGLLVGAIIISLVMNKLLKTKYTLTFSIVFGLFLSIIPNVLTDVCVLGFNKESVISIIICVVSFVFSLLFENLENIKWNKVVGIKEHVSKLFKSNNKKEYGEDTK